MDTKNGASDNKMVDVSSIMLENLFIYSQSMGRKTSQFIRTIAEQFSFADIVDDIGYKLEEHPVLRFGAVLTAMSCAIPVILFIVFGLISVTITFTGFLLVEGILLVVGGVCMLVCLMSMVMVMTVFGIMFVASYFMLTKVRASIQNYQLKRFLRHVRTIRMNNRRRGITNSIDDVHQD